MEDQDREARIDEDVEAHRNKLAPSRNKLANDEGDDDDVEAHRNKLAPNRNKLANDEGDDVEGHWHKAAPAKHKA